MKKELKIGIFVIAVMVASFFVLNYLRGEDIFNREYEVVSRYENVEGLVASAPVYIKGYKAGKVKEVTYDTAAGDFIVTCSVFKDFIIPSDSKMVIYAVDIMGGKGVRIDLGSSDIPAEDGSLLSPCHETGMIDALASEIGPLMHKVSQTLDSLNVTVSGVNKLLSDTNVESIGRILRKVELTISDLRSLSSAVNGRSGEITAMIDNLHDFSSKLGGIAEKVDTTMAGVTKIVDTVNSSDIDGLVTSFRELLQNINDPDGSVGKLLNSDSVYNSVDSLLNDVNILVHKIQENPKKYLKISVF